MTHTTTEVDTTVVILGGELGATLDPPDDPNTGGVEPVSELVGVPPGVEVGGVLVGVTVGVTVGEGLVDVDEGVLLGVDVGGGVGVVLTSGVDVGGGDTPVGKRYRSAHEDER